MTFPQIYDIRFRLVVELGVCLRHVDIFVSPPPASVYCVGYIKLSCIELNAPTPLVSFCEFIYWCMAFVQRGYSSLSVAAAGGHTSCVRLLAQAGVDINATDRVRHTLFLQISLRMFLIVSNAYPMILCSLLSNILSSWHYHELSNTEPIHCVDPRRRGRPHFLRVRAGRPRGRAGFPRATRAFNGNTCLIFLCRFHNEFDEQTGVLILSSHFRCCLQMSRPGSMALRVASIVLVSRVLYRIYGLALDVFLLGCIIVTISIY